MPLKLPSVFSAIVFYLFLELIFLAMASISIIFGLNLLSIHQSSKFSDEWDITATAGLD